ncbi:MAG: hypothetical protein JWR15_2408 [Prosthecobacter sp.]|nr:hypothetical protein [Prosthecobacter sp.]
MKRSLLFLFAALFAMTAPLTPARADVSVPVDFFYDALSPYGDWIYVQDYGYVWQPLVAQQNNWAPYSDGYWAFTDAGWTWISNEDFGWITYHYGRWMRLGQNWAWVPGYEWAPAWVSWRQTQGQIGWAPLPPEASWVSNIGFGGWTDSYYDVGPSYYNFVPMAAFASTSSLRPFIMDRSRNYSFYDQSVNITHTNYQQNVPNHIFVGGPDPSRIDRLGSNQVRRLTLRHDDDGFRREWLDGDRGGYRDGQRGRGSFSRVERDQFVIAAPMINRDGPQRLPSRVREHMNQPEIDRGWRGAPDSDRLRQHQRDELARMRPPSLPEKNRQPVTSMTPPPATGRMLSPEERAEAGRQRDSRQAGEEVRPGVPMPGRDRPGSPGAPSGVTGESGRRGDMPPTADTPDRERRPGGLPGVKPGERPGEGPSGRTDQRPGERPSGRSDQRPGERPGGAPSVTPSNPRSEPQQPATPPSGREPEKPVTPVPTTPNTPGNRPDSRGNRPESLGNRPDFRGDRPDSPGNREGRPGRPQTEVPPSQPNVPSAPSTRPDFPGNREQRPGRSRAESPPSQPNVPPPAQSATPPPSSRVSPVPMPQPPQQETPPVRQMPAPSVNNPPRGGPSAPPPQAAPQAQPPPQAQNPGLKGPGGGHRDRRP